MRTLVLGGTAFLGHSIASEAVDRGHEVICAARGTSGQIPDGARLVAVDRNAVDGLEPLIGQKFDLVIDVAPMSYSWVTDALATLGTDARHWTFVSSTSVYADTITLGQNETAPLHPPIKASATTADLTNNPYLYAGIKVASENAVLEALGDRALIARPGLIIGPGDRSDRFGYWPARLSQGGQALVPDTNEQPVQVIDTRDLAAWIVKSGENQIAGTFNAIGPPQSFGGLLSDLTHWVGTPKLELVAASAAELGTAGVNAWRGPKSLPLWTAGESYGSLAHDHRKAAAAGLLHRPLAESVHDIVRYERQLGLDRARKAGLTAAEEADVLTSLQEGRLRGSGA